MVCVCVRARVNYHKELAHVIMDIEEFQDLQLAS